MKGFACFNTLKDVYGHYTLKKAFWNYHDNHPGDDAMALVNLYLPFFMFYRNSSEEEPGPPLQIDGKCCACMNVYQFWYTVDDTGEISITNHDSVRHGETFLLTNVSVAFDKAFGQSRILLSADTRLYDFSSKVFKDGRLSATFVRR